VRTGSGSDPIRTNVRADPVATAPGSDTEARAVAAAAPRSAIALWYSPASIDVDQQSLLLVRLQVEFIR
jgi:hypothetical protein